MQKGRIVKVTLNNGLTAQGIIESYTQEYLVLKQVDNCFVYIFQPNNNILMVHFLEKQEKQVAVTNDLELPKYEPIESLRTMKLAELHKMRAQEERKRAEELLKSKQIQNKEINYGYPNLGTQHFQKYPTKKT